MTNGEWIRKMSDRELAEFIVQQDPCIGRECKESSCALCMEAWCMEEHEEEKKC